MVDNTRWDKSTNQYRFIRAHYISAILANAVPLATADSEVRTLADSPERAALAEEKPPDHCARHTRASGDRNEKQNPKQQNIAAIDELIPALGIGPASDSIIAVHALSTVDGVTQEKRIESRQLETKQSAKIMEEIASDSSKDTSETLHLNVLPLYSLLIPAAAASGFKSTKSTLFCLERVQCNW